MMVYAGTIITIAGTGEPGFAGDGGPAKEACLNEPKNITFDRMGNLYIADSENHVIRRVDAQSHLITTIAGRHEASDDGPSSVSNIPDNVEDDPLADPVGSASAYTQAADLSGMVRYVTGTRNQGRFSGDGGPASAALLNFPSDVAVDRDGVLYIADTWNHRIRRVDPDTGIITTLAGNGKARYAGDGGPAIMASLNEPVAVVVDEEGHLYIADQSNNRVRMVDLATGLIHTVAGSGVAGYTGDGQPAVETGLAGPSGLALDAEGNVYIADTFSGRIRKLDKKTGIMTTIVGDGREFRYDAEGKGEGMSLSRPFGIAWTPEEQLLITDTDNHVIRRWDMRAHVMSHMAGNGQAGFGGDGQAPETCSLSFPFGIAISPEGHIAIADTFNHRIRMIASMRK
ncbi:MAG: hypothetical protein D6704_06420 [Nitrospirae bacterium]|nr:MAG: hypothetical protein D6704_06420 [Nitrospirota bacterium]